MLTEPSAEQAVAPIRDRRIRTEIPDFRDSWNQPFRMPFLEALLNSVPLVQRVRIAYNGTRYTCTHDWPDLTPGERRGPIGGMHNPRALRRFNKRRGNCVPDPLNAAQLEDLPT